MKNILMILAALGAVVLQGCSSALIKQDAQLQWEESRFARVRVLAEPLFVDTKIPGMNIRTFELFETNKTLISGFERVPFPYPDSRWNLQFGDIIDIYYGSDRWAHKYIRDNSKARQDADKAFLVLPENRRSQVLGVVCRAAEGDCERNSKHELAIGWGRKMRGPDDYRGVAAEAKQRIYQPEVDRDALADAPRELLLRQIDYETASYVKKGLSADYEDPPEERQEHYENPCGGVHAFIGCKDAPFFSLEDE